MRIAINGFGRIGRAFLRLASYDPSLRIVAINDLGARENLQYLLQYDTVYGRAPQQAMAVFAGAQLLQEKDPTNLPWKDLQIDVVVECTGFFTTYVDAKKHLDAGAKHVVISAPAKGTPEEAGVVGATVLMGLNEDKLATCSISSNASCTTNASSPVIAILDEAIGIQKAVLNTTHSYTATQALIDGPSKKGFREGRAAALNMIPSSTGAAIAVTQAYESLAGKFDGISVRVPTPAGSLADITFIAKRDTTVDEVNNTLRAAAVSPRWQGIFNITDEELVSSDIIGRTEGSIADLSMTRVVDGNLVKVLAWYDNEMGYAHTLVRHVIEAGKQI